MSAEAIAKLDALSLGFRGRFLTYDELTRQVRAWAETFPQLCRATSIGRTPEGRELWLLTLGPEPDLPARGGECLAQDLLDPPLRDHQRPRVGRVGGRLGTRVQVTVLMAAEIGRAHV